MKHSLFYILLLMLFVCPMAGRAEQNHTKKVRLPVKQKEVMLVSKADKDTIFQRQKRRVKTIDVGGVKRKYIIYVPSVRKMPKEGFPVVFVFHGGGGTAVKAQNMSKMHTLGREEGFIVVYPEGSHRSWNTDIISTAASKRSVDDVSFFHRLLDDLVAQYRVNPDMVYVCGISNGGHISYYLAKRAGERIGALAVVASGIASEENYRPLLPRPVMVIHGTDDESIPYKGGQGKRDRYLSVEETLSHLLEVNNASPESLDYSPYPKFKPTSKIETFYYPDKQKGNDVVLIKVNGGGHTWPGGHGKPSLGRTSRAISANRAIWEFFNKHPRR